MRRGGGWGFTGVGGDIANLVLQEEVIVAVGVGAVTISQSSVAGNRPVYQSLSQSLHQSCMVYLNFTFSDG